MCDKGVISTERHLGHTHRQWFVAILANSTLISYGLQAGWISPMTKILQSDNSPTGHALSDTVLSWVACVICLTAVAGVHLYTYVADSFGRKAAVILIVVPQALCWLIKFSSANTTILITARVFCGLSAGGCFNIIPIYTKEISRDDIRALTGSLMMLFLNIGFLLMYILGAYLDYFTVLWTVTWIPFVTLLLMFKAPESPSYLVKVGKIEEATSVIAWLRGLDENDKSVQNEISNLNDEKRLVESLQNISYISLFKHRSWRIGIILMATLMTLTALNGCFAILTYASALLATSGVTMSAELLSLSFPTLMIVGGFVSMSCVERFGRKPLLTITNLMVSASTFGLGIVIHIQTRNISVPSWLPATLMMTAVASYSTGAGPVPYIMMSEMFNFQIRAKVLGLIISYSWFISFLQLLSYSPIAAALGAHTAFYCFGLLSFAACLVALLLLPETKGKSVEEIEARYKKNGK